MKHNISSNVRAPAKGYPSRQRRTAPLSPMAPKASQPQRPSTEPGQVLPPKPGSWDRTFLFQQKLCTNPPLPVPFLKPSTKFSGP